MPPDLPQAADPLEPARCATLLGALASPERLRIVRLLAGGRRNVTEIVEALGIPPLNVSHHLTVLRTAGLLTNAKEGRFVYYSLAPAVGGVRPDGALDLGCCKLVVPGLADEGDTGEKAGG